MRELLEQEKLTKKNMEELKNSIYHMSLTLAEQENDIQTYKVPYIKLLRNYVN